MFFSEILILYRFKVKTWGPGKFLFVFKKEKEDTLGDCLFGEVTRLYVLLIDIVLHRCYV